MEQLFMRRPNLDDLPELDTLPEGYTLREYRDGDLEPLAALMRNAFSDASWTPGKVREVLIDDPNVPATWVIDYNGVPVATASALVSPDSPTKSGTVHWVAADASHKGKRLGYLVSLAVLHEFARRGCRDADLLTDDARLPALKTYLNLGFLPVHRHESHPARWAEIDAKLAKSC